MLISTNSCSSAPPPIIELRDIVAHYDDALALNSISLVVPRQSIVSIIGANGSGKTTSLRVMNGLVRPTSGMMLINGEPVPKFNPDELVGRGIAHSPEGRRIFPYMTVEENLMMGAFTVRDRVLVAQRRDAVFDIFPLLKARAGELGHNLSGGQQQMLAIARAYMSNPMVLLLDEPTLGLAPKIMQDVSRLILRLREEGLTVVLVEQNAEIALKLADYVYVLANGQVMAEGAPNAIRESEEIRSAYLGA